MLIRAASILALGFLVSIHSAKAQGADDAVVCAAVMPECEDGHVIGALSDTSSPCYGNYEAVCQSSSGGGLIDDSSIFESQLLGIDRKAKARKPVSAKSKCRKRAKKLSTRKARKAALAICNAVVTPQRPVKTRPTRGRGPDRGRPTKR